MNDASRAESHSLQARGERRDFGMEANRQLLDRHVETPAWAEKLVRLLDDAVRIPGTDWRVGLDGIVGFFLPGAGDALTAVGSLSLLVLALRSGVPKVILARMVMNIAIDAFVGAIPLVGDLFDLAWKANRRNLELIAEYRGNPEAKAGAGDYALVALGIVFILISFMLPLLAAIAISIGLSSLANR